MGTTFIYFLLSIGAEGMVQVFYMNVIECP